MGPVNFCAIPGLKIETWGTHFRAEFAFKVWVTRLSHPSALVGE